jgi:neutral ceramidase
MMNRLLVLLVLLTPNTLWAADPVAPVFRAGAATSNITPDIGLDIIGGFSPIPSTSVHDELHARCLVLDDGKTKLAMVVCDLLGLSRSLSIEARQQIQAATGIPPEHVMISGTHTHSAASALGERGYQSDQDLNDYQKFVAKRISDGVRRAVNQLRPAQIGFGSVDVPEHLFNRRWFLKEGSPSLVSPFGKVDKVKMNPPGGSPDLVEPAGPTDPTVSFIAVREPGGRMLSIFSAYSLHYVGGVAGADISADYFAVCCETLKKLQPAGDQDPPFVALLANGTSGDCNNINFRTPRPGKPPYEQMRYVAEDVAAKINTALAGVTWQDHVPLRASYRELDVAWRTVEPALLDWAILTETKPENLLKKNDIAVIYAGRIKRLAMASPTTKLPVQVLRIGDICIGTSPCETFAETGIEFRQRSPIAHSFMVELAHGYYGYLPTPRHFELGGYETWPGTNYLEPMASEKIMAALLELAGELKIE